MWRILGRRCQALVSLSLSLSKFQSHLGVPEILARASEMPRQAEKPQPRGTEWLSAGGSHRARREGPAPWAPTLHALPRGREGFAHQSWAGKPGHPLPVFLGSSGR